jgi:prepilin-type N-terminal cleavage/methylation domain-containing protein
MKRRSSRGAFTLVEMLIVVALIAILAGIAVAIYGFAWRKGASTRALGEIHEMASACESYKTDMGGYPQNKHTDALDPKIDANPVAGAQAERYQKACIELYSRLAGDFLPNDEPDGQPEKKAYIHFTPNRLKFSKRDDGQIKQVKFIMDPFGNCYGYSTMQLAEEQKYREDMRKDPKTPRPAIARGYNSRFDLWSTGGQTSVSGSGKWVKNWGR